MQNRPRVLIADLMHESIFEMLESMGYTPDYQPHIDRNGIIDALTGATGLFIRSKTTVNEGLLAKADRLRFVARAGAGLDKLDLEALDRRGVQVLNAPEGNRDALAEHMVGMLLALFNRLTWADQEVRKGIWDREANRGWELMGKTVGLIGYGYMGQAFAQRLSGFNCRVLAYDKYRSDYGNAYAEEVSLEQLQAEAEIVSFHTPLTPETRGMADGAFWEAFKHSIFVVNSARGEIVPLQDLVAGMQSGKIRGAILDVLENEKLTTLTVEQQQAMEFLTASQSVIFTPHVAGWTHESYIKINQTLIQKLKQLGLDE